MATVNKSQVKIKTGNGDIERKVLYQDLIREYESDEDGGEKTRFELDSDFSDVEEEGTRGELTGETQACVDSKENWSNILTTFRSKHNTGPKGVRADYAEAQAIIRRRQETKMLMENERFKAIAYGSKMENGNKAISFEAQRDETRHDHAAQDTGDLDDNFDDDMSFLEAYRLRRVQEMYRFSRLVSFDCFIMILTFFSCFC